MKYDCNFKTNLGIDIFYSTYENVTGNASFVE